MILALLKVLVKDCTPESVSFSLKILKKKLQREGVFKELKRFRFAESRSERKTRKKCEALKRLHKVRKQILQNRKNSS